MIDRRRLALGTVLSALLLAGPSPLPAGPLRDTAGPYRLEVLIDGEPATTFRHERETYVLGQLGRRYTLRVVNTSAERIEAVVSVDGLDVLDGKPANASEKRGYVVPAWGTVEIEGFRISSYEAAAFRFSRVAESYAARTGEPRNVGVIGVAVFAERVPRRIPHAVAVPRPETDGRADAGRSAERDKADGNAAGAPTGGERAEIFAQAPEAPSDSVSEGKDGGAGASSSEADGPSARTSIDHNAQSKSASAEREGKRERPGLGTEFGEAVSSPVHEVSFLRASPDRPDAFLGARYNDRDGLIAMGVDVDGWGRSRRDAELRRSANPFPDSRPYAEPPAGWRQ